MIEKGSISWASVSSSPLDQKSGKEPIDRRGGGEKSTNWVEELHGKVAAEMRSTAPAEDDPNDRLTHRGDERRRKADKKRRGTKSTGRRGAERSTTSANEWTWEKPSDDRDQHLGGLPNSVKTSVRAERAQKNKSISAPTRSKSKRTWADLKIFASDTSQQSFCQMTRNFPLKVSCSTALDPLGGGFVWPLDLLQAAEERAGI